MIITNEITLLSNLDEMISQYELGTVLDREKVSFACCGSFRKFFPYSPEENTYHDGIKVDFFKGSIAEGIIILR